MRQARVQSTHRAALTGPSQLHVRLHGLELSITGDVELFLSHLGDLWAQLPLRPSSARAPVSIAIEICTWPLVGRAEQSIAGERQPGGVALVRRAGMLHVLHPAAEFEVQCAAGMGRLALCSNGASINRRAYHDVFLIGLSRLLTRHALFDLHAACVCGHDLCCLLIGPSGSGKSTATINLIRSGWDYVSDDAVLLRAGRSGVEALSFRRTPLLDPDALPCLSELRNGDAPATRGGKQFIDVERLYRTRQLQSGRPTALVLCELSGEERSSFSPVTGLQALLALVAQSASLGFTREQPRAQMETLRDLVRQCKALRLRAGRDLLVQGEGLSALLIEALRAPHPAAPSAAVSWP